MRESEQNETDEALMERYLVGDVAAFDALFDRYAPRLYRFFQRSFGARAVAEDLLQTTLLKLHSARRTYRMGMPLKPWLFTVAARVRLDEWRRRMRKDVKEDDLDEEIAAPAKEGIDKQAQETVRAAVTALPEAQRTVVQLHYFEGLSFKEIGDILACSEGAVKLRAHRAYERLRSVLDASALESA